MFGSQALGTAIGLALLFFVLAFRSLGHRRGRSRILQKRARDLEATLHDMLTGRGQVAAATGARPPHRPGATPGASPSTSTGATPATPPDVLEVFRGTSVYASVVGAAAQVGWISRWLSGRLPHRFATRLSDRRGRPTYMSARAFADTVMELMADDKLQDVPGWEGLRARLRTLDAEAGQLLHIKAGLESWFDETMARLSNAYKRWTTSVLFVVGLIIAAMGNVSTIQMAQTLWEQPVVRQAALDAAQQAAAKGASPNGLVTGNVQSIQDLSALASPGLVGADALGPTVVGRAACPGLGGHGAVGHARCALLVRCASPAWCPCGRRA